MLVVIDKQKFREPCWELFYPQSAIGLFVEYDVRGIQKLFCGLFVKFTYNLHAIWMLMLSVQYEQIAFGK